MPERIQIIKSYLDTTTYGDACQKILVWSKEAKPRHVIPANVHVLMSGLWSRKYQAIVDTADIVTPDGMPLVWAMRMMGAPRQQRVYGPDLTLQTCKMAANEGIPIYLYGGTERMINRLEATLKKIFPTLQIAGSKAPPFRQLSESEMDADAKVIIESGARIVLVGLGTPKQDHWILYQKKNLPVVMLGVGAAFQFISGEVKQAPKWMMSHGLEWAFRIWSEPRRVWRRHIINDPCFLIMAGIQILRHWLKPARYKT